METTEAECPVCYNASILYPLECDHQFCLSCIKALHLSGSPSSRISVQCPLCRTTVKRRYIQTLTETPERIRSVNLTDMVQSLLRNRSFVWIYEGRNNGWWYYNEEIQDLLQRAEARGEEVLQWCICGQSVHIDMVNNVQTNQCNGSVRDIKKISISETSSYLIKGIAGMK